MGLCVSDEFASEDLVDLPPRRGKQNDPMNHWELQTPFARTNFYTYAYWLNQAH